MSVHFLEQEIAPHWQIMLLIVYLGALELHPSESFKFCPVSNSQFTVAKSIGNPLFHSWDILSILFLEQDNTRC